MQSTMQSTIGKNYKSVKMLRCSSDFKSIKRYNKRSNANFVSIINTNYHENERKMLAFVFLTCKRACVCTRACARARACVCVCVGVSISTKFIWTIRLIAHRKNLWSVQCFLTFQGFLYRNIARIATLRTR